MKRAPDLQAIPETRAKKSAKHANNRPPVASLGILPALEPREPIVPPANSNSTTAGARRRESPTAEHRPTLQNLGLRAVVLAPEVRVREPNASTRRAAPAKPTNPALNSLLRLESLPFPPAPSPIPAAHPASAAGEAASDKELNRLAEQLERLLRAEARRHGLDL